MAFRYKFGEEEIKETEQARKKNKDKRAEARMKALELRAKGAEARLSRFRNSCKFSPCDHNAGAADQRHVHSPNTFRPPE